LNNACHKRAVQTADMANDSDLVLALGDLAYESGTTAEYQNYYDYSWGRVKVKTRPAVGNHEYLTPNAAGYFNYFGAAAGDPTKGYYSYNQGGVHFIAINTNCSKVGGCGVGSPQYNWLQADLQANANSCSVLYMHHPRYSSGTNHGSYVSVDPLWDLFLQYGGDIGLAGHEHQYERFAPQNANDQADPNGAEFFVVGTGGKNVYGFGTPVANSLVREAGTFGILTLEFSGDGYTYQFEPILGQTFTDSGSGSCT
jgi:3',5'-cyclic AMP phosphodiesterase CpdA